MKKRKYLVYGISLMMILLIGLTYAYFSIIILGEKKKVTVNTTDLRIVFDNGDDIEGINIEPGWSITKTFSVENKTNYEYKYNLVFKDLINTFVTKGYLVYKITSTNNGYNMSEYADMPKSNVVKNTIIEYNISIASNVKQEYTIEIKYINDNNVDQSDDMGKELSANLYIESGSDAPTFEKGTLAYKMLEDNSTISERKNFSITNTENTTGIIYKTNKTESGNYIYYYSGNTTNNWVYFGGFYWRIIRTNEDKGARLLYVGPSHNTTEGYIGTSKFNNNVEDPLYVGYMYGTSSSLENNRTNENDSIIKIAIDTWYENNLLNNYDKYISKEAIYCNDRSVGSGAYNIGTDTFQYGSVTRLDKNYAPSYKCGANTSNGLFEKTQAIEDKFSASTSGGGNGQLTYPIALMTADEFIFAGGKSGGALSSPYAWFYTNSEGNSVTGVKYWYLLSPYFFYNSKAYLFYVYSSSNPGYLGGSAANNPVGVRPVISLSSCVKVTGSGIPGDPYVLDEVNSTC